MEPLVNPGDGHGTRGADSMCRDVLTREGPCVQEPAAFLTVLSAAGVLAATAAGGGPAALAASWDSSRIKPGDLLVSGTIYQNPGIVAGQTQLPPGCPAPSSAPARS